MRTIIIGDIHGCKTELEKLLDKIQPKAGKDRLVFLGDLFDRGPDSLGVFQMVRALAAEFCDDFILLRGNHEDFLLQTKLTRQQRMIWDRVGRQATVLSFQKAGERMENSIPWIQEHAQFFWKTEGFQCVHAGVRVEPLEANDFQTMIHDHETAFINRYTGKLTITGHIGLEKATWFAGDGVTTEELSEGRVRSLPKTGILCIDTGCGKGGRLTAMIVEGQNYMLQSAAEN